MDYPPLPPRRLDPIVTNSSMMDFNDGASAMNPMLNSGSNDTLRRASFRDGIQAPLQKAYQNTKLNIQAKAPGFFYLNGQLMIISVLAIIFYILCVLRIQTAKEMPIVVGAIMTGLTLYFVYRYTRSIPSDKYALAGWLMVVALLAAIITLGVWVEKAKTP